MRKLESVSVLTLTHQKTGFLDTTRLTHFYFEDNYLYQGKTKASSFITLFCFACIYTTVDIMPELKINILILDMESTISMRE